MVYLITMNDMQLVGWMRGRLGGCTTSLIKGLDVDKKEMNLRLPFASIFDAPEAEIHLHLYSEHDNLARRFLTHLTTTFSPFPLIDVRSMIGHAG